MPELSVTDLTVASRNLSLYELLWRLPTDLVLDFLERANAWELRHGMPERVASTVELVHEPIARTSGLGGECARTARECVEFLLCSNATTSAMATQLEHGADAPLRIEWRGVEHMRQGAVVFAPHFGYLYAVPLALAALGRRSAVLGGEAARDVLLGPFGALAPRLIGSVDYLLVPSPGCAKAALDTLNRGELLVMFPEVNRGATAGVGSAATSFLGRTIRLPTTAARLARMAGVDIVPATATPVTARHVVIEFGEPVAAPVDRHGDVPVSVRLFDWIERMVRQRPQLWLGWPMLDTDMAVTGPVAG